jgi:hypothetical protein
MAFPPQDDEQEEERGGLSGAVVGEPGETRPAAAP